MSFRFFPWMRLSWVVRNKRHSAFCFYGFQPLAKSAPASAHSPLERIILFSHAHKVNKKRIRTSLILFLFTLDAIRTHDLPLRRRLLYPAELPRPISKYYHENIFLQLFFTPLFIEPCMVQFLTTITIIANIYLPP